MADKSKIEWTDSTWNPIRARDNATGKIGWHCTHVSEGCRNCYAEGFNLRLGTGQAYKPAALKDIEVYLSEDALHEPIRWQRPRTIFVCSMTDLFADFVTDAMLDKIFAIMALTPRHTYQLVTKRAARMRSYLQALADGERHVFGEARDLAGPTVALADLLPEDEDGQIRPLPNVWVAISAEDQDALDERLPHLQAAPVAHRFLSLEPLLAPLSRLNLDGIDLVIVGGESGPNARPLHPDWVRWIRDVCALAGATFFFKQWGEWQPVCAMSDEDSDAVYRPAPKRDPDGARRCRVEQAVLHADGSRHDDPADWQAYAAGSGAMLMFKVGKKRAGASLDGRVHQLLEAA